MGGETSRERETRCTRARCTRLLLSLLPGHREVLWGITGKDEEDRDDAATGAFGDNYIKSPKTEKRMKPNIRKAILGGFAATAVMTFMMYFVAPMMKRAADGYCRHAGIDVGR